MKPEEADRLPLTQYLVMETLAGRYRTGETHWTFPTKATPAVRALEGHGLVRWKSGIVEKTILVWLTDEGRDAFLMPGCTPPSDEDRLTTVAKSGLVALARRLGATVEDFEAGADV